MSDDLTYRTLDPHDDSPENATLLRGWIDGFLRGFHQRRASDDYAARTVAAYRAENSVVRGVWDRPLPGVPAEVPVATFAHFVKTINTGATIVPAWMITDVTVAPTHRRRGIMRRLMTENLAAAAESDAPVAILTASEGAIYQRFGFGPATREARLRVSTSHRFRIRDRPDDGGRLVIVEGEAAWPLVERVLTDEHAITRGSVDRPAPYEAIYRGYDWDEQSEDHKQRIAVRFGADGVPDGFVRWVMKTDDEWEVSVRDLVSTTPAAHLGLWQFLADLDLAEIVTASTPVVDPLSHALVDPRVVRTTGVGDHLWVRVLDVAAALGARPWFGEDRIVLRVADALGHAEGTYAVTASSGRATVERVDSEPDVTLDVETLGSLWLGDVTVDTMVRAGRLDGDSEALRRFGAIADGGAAPWCDTHF